MPSASLRQLVGLHSRLAGELIDFLEQFANAIDRTPWEFGGRELRVSSAFVEPTVFTDDERGGGDVEALVRTATRVAAPSPQDDKLRELYERKRQSGRHEERRWSQVVNAVSRLRLVVTGEPGGGKTYATCHTAATLARAGLKQLRSHSADVSEVMLALWITAQHLAEQPPGIDLAEAVVGALEKQSAFAGLCQPRLREWLCGQVRGAKVLVVVDALDELRNPEQMELFKGRLAELGRSEASLIVTCRTLPWERLKSLVSWPSAYLTVELKSLESARQIEYAAKFFLFLGREGLEAELERRFLRDVSLREHARTPLVLAFICGLLTDDALPEESSSAKLYRQVVRELLKGKWRKESARPSWAADRDCQAEVHEFLPALAWKLFQEAASSNRFARPSWKAAFEYATQQVGEFFLDQLTFRKDLASLGLLVDGGTDEKDRECWSFAHRTVLEFIAAEGLHAATEKPGWLRKVPTPLEANRFWFHPEWIPTLTFLAAIMEDATPLLEALDVPPLVGRKAASGDDFLGHAFALKCRFAGAGKKTSEAVVGQLAHQWISRWKATLNSKTERSVSLLEEAGEKLATHPAAERILISPLLQILSTLRDHRKIKPDSTWLNTERRAHIVQGLGVTRHGAAIEPLLTSLPRTGYWEDDAIATALGKIGGRRLVGPLMQQLNRDTDVHGPSFYSIVNALVTIGDRNAVNQLLGYLAIGRASSSLRCLIAIGLGDLGDHAAVESLLSGMLHEELAYTRGLFAYALGLLGDTAAVEPMLFQLDREDEYFARINMVHALGKLGDRRAVEPLKTHLWVRADKSLGEVAFALRALKDSDAVSILLTRLQDEGFFYARWHFITALGRLGDSAALETLLERSRTEADNYQRLTIANAIGDLGDSAAGPPLLAWLESETSGCVRVGIIDALRKLRHDGAVQLLLKRLVRGEKYAITRESIADYLGEFGDQTAIAPLRAQWSREEFPSVRESITAALWKIVERERCYAA